MDFKTVPNQYRPIPFWSWNEKLDTKETKRQIKIMHDAGIGGFFMHARGGLQTEYMGKEWFENVKAAAEYSKELDMGAWAYDENGWPSGFGGGRVNGKGEKYQQKYLRMEAGEQKTPHTISNQNGLHFYYEVNPFYVDTLDREVIADFIQEIYAPYYDRFGNEIVGFFTDEPQISRDGIPWSMTLPDAYRAAYGEELIPRLEELFHPMGNYADTRIKFWKLVTDLFSKNYMKQIYDWCTERGLQFTGHLVSEETLESQLTSNGAVMPHYEYFSIPGMDWLGRPVEHCLTPYQVSSVAQQLGKKQVLSETFALCGHNVGFEELKRIYSWQMVHGINLLCQHLEGYSLRGIRKRDYPPAMYYQQPWWAEYKTFVDAMSRTGMILAEGEAVCDTLLIHPQTAAWTMFDNDQNEGLAELNTQFLNMIRQLDEKHIQFHLGDETIMERYARVEKDKLIIGNQQYTKVILPPQHIFLSSTEALLGEFTKNGGKIFDVQELDADNIIDNPYITYTKRQYQGFTVHYFVNTTDAEQEAIIREGGKIVDDVTGEMCPFDGKYIFAPFDSLLVIDDGTPQENTIRKKALKSIPTDGEWEITSASENALLLDFCDYYFDGVPEEKDGYVLNIQNRACALRRPVEIRQEYTVKVQSMPEELFLVIETPEIYTITINGKAIRQTDAGYFRDRAFRKIPVAEYFAVGVNTIILSTIFRQSATVYESLDKSLMFESEKNKLVYDMEIEPIFLVGPFSVRTEDTVIPLDKDAFRCKGKFRLDAPQKQICLKHMEQQGFLFFAGELVLEKTIWLEDTEYKLVLDKKGINAVQVNVNGQEAGVILWNPTEMDLTPYLQKGENVIRLTVYNNLRNMMGPHHLQEGETYFAAPSSFFKEPCVWNKNPESAWNEAYCFVEMSL